MSDEREGAGSADAGADADSTDSGQTALVTRPARPTGKRSRRGAATETAGRDPGDDEAASGTDGLEGEDDDDTKGRGGKKTAKKPKDGPSRNPFAFVRNYLQEVIGELRKVIWPNRKQMVTYTTVVLLFLVFMVALIGFTDLGVGRIVMMVFG